MHALQSNSRRTISKWPFEAALWIQPYPSCILLSTNENTSLVYIPAENYNAYIFLMHRCDRVLALDRFVANFGSKILLCSKPKTLKGAEGGQWTYKYTNYTALQTCTQFCRQIFHLNRLVWFIPNCRVKLAVFG
jgi:hypothetical protein